MSPDYYLIRSIMFDHRSRKLGKQKQAFGYRRLHVNCSYQASLSYPNPSCRSALPIGMRMGHPALPGLDPVSWFKRPIFETMHA